jgi:hypothetical protein
MRNEDEMNQRKWLSGGIFLVGLGAATAFVHPAAIVKSGPYKAGGETGALEKPVRLTAIGIRGAATRKPDWHLRAAPARNSLDA